MKHGITISNFGVSSKPQDYATLAKAAEDSGWDGFFVWDHLNFGRSVNILDPWILLAVVAQNTETVRIGTAVTPLPRRRPQKVASEVVTLDRLSEGRMVLGVGLGWPPKEFRAFGEESDIRIRAQKFEESLEIIEGLWLGDSFSFKGNHYTVDDFRLHPTCVQKPRVPIWAGATWPKKKPFRRAARYDGVVPIGTRDPSAFAEMKKYTEKHRKSKGEYAWVCSLTYPSKPKRDELLSQFEQAGATWYLESWGTGPFEKQMRRTKRSPPDI